MLRNGGLAVDVNPINWSEAPEWALWCSRDRSGNVWWGGRPEWASSAGTWVQPATDDIRWGYADPVSGVEHLGDTWLVQKPPRETANALPKTSPDASASSPSEEFRYAWFEPARSEHGFWHRTKDEAVRQANENYLDFPPSLKDRSVYIAECVGVANAGDSA